MAITVDRSALVTALVNDGGFHNRLQSLFVSAGNQIYAESPGTSPRRAFADKVFKMPRQIAVNAAAFLLQTDNFIAKSIVGVPLGSGVEWKIDTTDAEGMGQIVDKWDALAALFS